MTAATKVLNRSSVCFVEILYSIKEFIIVKIMPHFNFTYKKAIPYIVIKNELLICITPLIS